MLQTIITEKPSVARDIARILGVTGNADGYIHGNGYIITWAFGHLLSLAMPDTYGFSSYRKEDLPIIPDEFRLLVRQTYSNGKAMTDKGAEKQLNIIKHCFDKCDKIIVATDAGREGELIFRYIYKYLNCKKPFERLWISSLTDKAIKHGFANLQKGNKYDMLYLSGKARAESDWIVGINSSRALAISTGKTNQSLGRVQTPTLAMICKRYLDNKNFKSVDFYRIKAIDTDYGISFASVKTFDNKDSAVKVMGGINLEKPFMVSKATIKDNTIKAPLLYDLTTLQKEANRKLGFSADRTLNIAQSLYEKKVTTYPRTASRYVSRDIFDEYPSILKAIFTMNEYSHLSKSIDMNCLNANSVDDTRITDHHAIIPTGETASLSDDEMAVYSMVVNRFMESVHPDARSKSMHIVIMQDDIDFEAKLSSITFKGWKAIASDDPEVTDEEVSIARLPDIADKDLLFVKDVSIADFKTKPLPLYTEAGILSAMENAGKDIDDKEKRDAIKGSGIGTPATRAAIIETLLKRQYIKRDKKNLIPTEIGLSIYSLVKDKRISDVELSADLEYNLSNIENGILSIDEFNRQIQEFTAITTKELMECNINLPSLNDIPCPRCKENTMRLYPKVSKCSKCELTIFRNICGVSLSDATITKLCKTGKSELVKKFISPKTNKTFEAYIVFDNDFKPKFEFPKKK